MCALTKNGQLKTCKEYGLKEQAYEHIDNCNTWNRATCSELVPKLMVASDTKKLPLVEGHM